MKKIYLLVFIVTIMAACKSSKEVSTPQPPGSEFQKTLSTERKTDTQKPARDLHELMDRMELSSEKRQEVLNAYKEAGLDIINLSALKLDKKEEKKRREKINNSRDKAVRSVLNREQVRMYNRYLWNRKQRNLANKSKGNQSNY